jgi:hypothetical protein
MLQVLAKGRNIATIQFTGADLKKWYGEFGKEAVFFCHVMGSVMKHYAGTCRMYPNSDMVIEDMRKLAPKRFKAPVTWSRTIDNNLKLKYVPGGKVGGTDVSFRLRVNLLKCIPDDHVFTWNMML